MRNIQILFIGLVCLSIVACTKGLNEDQSNKLNLLQSRLDSTLNKIEAVDTAKNRVSFDHFFENIRFIQEEMTDTITPELALFFDDYYSMRKAFKMYAQEYPLILNELKISKKQLADLKHDGEAGILEDGQFEKYYHLESNNLVLAEEKANEVLYAIETIEPMYDEMNPKVDSILNIYRTKESAEK